jgi:hypothetical protein
MTTPEKQPKTLTDHLQAIGGALLIVGFTLLLLEGLLRFTDPWDIRYFNDLAVMGNEHFVGDAERGYIMPDGSYRYSHWSATIADSTRLTPATNAEAACEIVILGDSVAFGYGVDDADVWLNQLAAQFPDVHFVNTGVPRYNSTNVLRTFAAFPAGDAYLYLIINNDIASAIDPETMEFAGGGEGLPFLVRYANFAIYRGGGTAYIDPTDPTVLLSDTAETQRFFSEVDTLIADERLYLAAFELEASTNTLLDRDYPVTVLEYPPQRISITDYHLTPAGNGELANQLVPLIETMVSERCSG